MSLITASDAVSLFSLATLRECTIEVGEGGPRREAAAASAHSVISAIPSEEVQRMIQEVRSLDEETLKVKVSLLHVAEPQPLREKHI